METTVMVPAWLESIMVFDLIFVAVLCWGLFTVGQRSNNRGAAWFAMGYLLLWYALLYLLNIRNTYQIRPDVPPLLLQPVVLGLVIPLLLFGLIKPLRELMFAIPLTWIVGVQAFRVMGTLFLVLYALGHLPAIFGVPAGIGDTIISFAALPLAYLISKRHPYALAWTVAWALFGMADHLMAFSIGFLSSPGPLRHLTSFGGTNPIITMYPLVIFPTFRVPIGLFINIFVLWKVSRERKGLRQQSSTAVSLSAVAD